MSIIIAAFFPVTRCLLQIVDFNTENHKIKFKLLVWLVHLLRYKTYVWLILLAWWHMMIIELIPHFGIFCGKTGTNKLFIDLLFATMVIWMGSLIRFKCWHPFTHDLTVVIAYIKLIMSSTFNSLSKSHQYMQICNSLKSETAKCVDYHSLSSIVSHWFDRILWNPMTIAHETT